jgi:hypothetical protein
VVYGIVTALMGLLSLAVGVYFLYLLIFVKPGRD